MFIAMNRFIVNAGRETDFEEMWRRRESYLEEVPGFKKFHLLRGPEQPNGSLYISHSVWESRKSFENWTDSELFRKAHSQGRAPEGTYAGPPQFEGFEAII